MLNQMQMYLPNPFGIDPCLFQNNTRVVNLDLKDTGLGPEGGKYVAAMLLENDYLYSVVRIKFSEEYNKPNINPFFYNNKKINV